MSRSFRVVVVRVQRSADDLVEAAIARALRQAGFEVIVASPATTAEQAAEAVLQEDAAAVVVVGAAPAGSSADSDADRLDVALAVLGLDDVAVVSGTSTDDVVSRLVQALGAGPPAGLGAGADS